MKRSNGRLPRTGRRILAPVMVVFLLGFAGSAAAEPAFCGSLRSQYAAAERAASSGSNDAGRIRREYANLQAEARRKGCQRFLFFGPRPSPQCPQIMGRLNSLQRDLSRAGNVSWGGSSSRQASQDRDRLRQRLRESGCAMASGGRSAEGGATGGAGSGYRTLCVRSCDGYYFPVSFSASRTRFKVDEVVCKAMYGGSEAELYVHPNRTSVENAVSLQGQSYQDLPGAFAYRSSFTPKCQRQLHAGLDFLAVAQASRAAEAEEKARSEPRLELPLPVVRINPGEDPETLASRAGDFRIRPVGRESGPVLVAGAVRQLGPAYYYSAPILIDGLARERWKPIDLSLLGSAEAREHSSVPGATTTVH